MTAKRGGANGSPAIAVGLSGPLALVALARPVGPSTLLDVHDVNGGCIGGGARAARRLLAHACGPLGDVLVVVTACSVELRAPPSLQITKKVDSKLFAPPGEAPTPSLLTFAPDPLAPCAAVAAFDDGWWRCACSPVPAWAERRAQRRRGRALLRRASQVMRFAASVACAATRSRRRRASCGRGAGPRLPSFRHCHQPVSTRWGGRLPRLSTRIIMCVLTRL